MFDKIKEFLETNDAFATMTGIVCVEASENYGKVSMPLEPKLLNALKFLHGGATATIADMAFGLAANYGKEHHMISINLNISYLKMVKKGPIVAEGRLLNGGKQLGTYEVKIFDGEGTLVACAQVNGFRLNPRP